VLFGVRPANRPANVRLRAADLEQYHRKLEDRMVLAEAEDLGFSALLSFDNKFIKRLQQHARLHLTAPKDCWDSLAIPNGADPVHLPRNDNPLLAQTWWRW
jgi:hypothetical protein